MGLHVEEAMENEFHCTSKKGWTHFLSFPQNNKTVKRLICLLKFLIFVGSNSTAQRCMPSQPVACWGVLYAGIHAWSC